MKENHCVAVYKQDITLAIPTRNHAHYLTEIFGVLSRRQVLCPIIVLDSSTDDETRFVCSQSQHLQVRYVRCDPDMPPDSKSILAVKECRTEYLWILGDGLIPEIDTVLETIPFENGFDIIHLVDLDARDTRRYYRQSGLPLSSEYTDAAAFFRDYFWTGTFMGALIIRRSYFQRILDPERIEKYLGSGFAIICAVLDVACTEPFYCLVKAMHYYTPNPKKLSSAWMGSTEIFDLWAVNMPKSINCLPSSLSQWKPYVISTTAVRNQFLSRRGLIRWRGKGLFDREILQRYQEGLKKTSNVSLREMRVLASMPKFLCKLLFLPFDLRMKIKRRLGRLPI